MEEITTLGQQYEIMAGVGIHAENHVTFAGGNANDPGTLATTPYTLFKVSGLVAVKVYAVGVTTPVSGGSGTLAVGVNGSGAILIAATTATSIAAHKNWFNATPVFGGLSSNFTENVIDQDILLTVATGDVTAGSIRFIAIWRPLTLGATLREANLSAGSDISFSPSLSPSASISPSSSRSPSASASPSSSISPSLSPSLSPSASISPSSSVSGSVSATPSLSLSPSSSQSPSASRSPSSSVSPSPSPSTLF